MGIKFQSTLRADCTEVIKPWKGLICSDVRGFCGLLVSTDTAHLQTEQKNKEPTAPYSDWAEYWYVYDSG